MTKWAHCDHCGETFSVGHGLTECSARSLTHPTHDHTKLAACVGCIGGHGHAEWCPEKLKEEAVRTLADVALMWKEEKSLKLLAEECLRMVETAVPNVWLWEGGGENDPESLACPVVMSADTLRGILKERASLYDALDLKAREHDAALHEAHANGAREALAPWDDVEDRWSPAIDAAFPTRSGSHEEYGIALRMVRNRHSKGALVELVNRLLVERKKANASHDYEADRAVQLTKERDAAVAEADERISALADVLGATSDDSDFDEVEARCLALVKGAYEAEAAGGRRLSETARKSIVKLVDGGG